MSSRIKSSEHRLSIAVIFCAFLLILSIIGVNNAFAAGAVLYFTPSSGNYVVGNSFSVKILVNSGGGVGINAADGVVSFDPAYLSLTKVDKTGSIFNLWTTEPTAGNGTITYSGGSPTAYKGNSGLIATVTFKALKEGTTKMRFSSGTVLAADGEGTNVLSQYGEANFTIGPAAQTPVSTKSPKPVETATLPVNLEVSSPTHPSEDKWYPNKNPKFTWGLPSGTNAVRTLMDKNATGKPAKVYSPPVQEITVENLEDGIWYFHIQARTASGWAPNVVTRKVLIDTVPPKPFEIEVKQKDATDNYPLLLFSTDDEISGVSYYEIKIGEGSSFQISVESIKSNPYRMPYQAAGKHPVTVKACDSAGNCTEAAIDVEVALAEGLVAQINEGEPEEKCASGTITLVLWIVSGLLLLAVVILAALLLLQKRGKVLFGGQAQQIQGRKELDMQEFKIKTKEIFDALREEVEEQVRKSDKKQGLSDPEKKVIEKLNDALDLSEELIKREIDEINHCN